MKTGVTTSIVLATVLLLTACGGTSSGDASSTAATPPGPSDGSTTTAAPDLTAATLASQQAAATAWMQTHGTPGTVEGSGLISGKGAGLLIFEALGLAVPNSTTYEQGATADAITQGQTFITSQPCAGNISIGLTAATPTSTNVLDFAVRSSSLDYPVWVQEWNAANPADVIAPVRDYLTGCAETALTSNKDAGTVTPASPQVAGKPAAAMTYDNTGSGRVLTSVLAWSGHRLVTVSSKTHTGSGTKGGLSATDLTDLATSLLSTG